MSWVLLCVVLAGLQPVTAVPIDEVVTLTSVSASASLVFFCVEGALGVSTFLRRTQNGNRLCCTIMTSPVFFGRQVHHKTWLPFVKVLLRDFTALGQMPALVTVIVSRVHARGGRIIHMQIHLPSHLAAGWEGQAVCCSGIALLLSKKGSPQRLPNH